MRLIHYSKEPLTEVKDAGSKICGVYKPGGLWVSVEGPDDWPAWCAAENFRSEEDFAWATEVTVIPELTLLLSSAEEIDIFTDRYVSKDAPKYARTVNWDLVSNDWHGLIIAPYCWERRMTEHTFWYYGWDCASGVIWNKRAVAGLNPIAREPAKPPGSHDRFAGLIMESDPR
jgi:hypothetical protein